MRALCLLFPETIETQPDGSFSLVRPISRAVSRFVPRTGALWIYFELLGDPADEGLPFTIRVDLVDPDGNASVVMEGEPIFPAREHPDLPAVWAMKLHTPVEFRVFGLHQVRVTVGDQLLAERPFSVAQTPETLT